MKYFLPLEQVRYFERVLREAKKGGRYGMVALEQQEEFNYLVVRGDHERQVRRFEEEVFTVALRKYMNNSVEKKISTRGCIVLEFKNPQDLLKNDIEKRFGVQINEENKKIASDPEEEKEEETQDRKPLVEKLQWGFERDPKETYDFEAVNKRFSYFTKDQEDILNFYAKKNYVGTFPIPSNTEWEYEVTFGKPKPSIR